MKKSFSQFDKGKFKFNHINNCLKTINKGRSSDLIKKKDLIV